MLRIVVSMIVLLAGTSAWAAEYLTDPTRAESWKLEPAGSAQATLRNDGNAIRVDITSPGAEAWHVQITQYNKPLQPGKHYALSFAAKASSPRTIVTYAQLGTPPWEHLWPAKDVNLTTEYQTFTFDVTVTKDAEGKGRMPVFAVGNVAGSVWFKDIQVNDGSGPAPAAPAAPAAAPAPTPVVADLGNDLMSNASDPAAWTLESHEGAASEMRAEDGGLRVDVTRSSNQRWHVQLFQGGKSLSPGKTYVLRFQARAAAPRKATVLTAQGLNDPWPVFGGQTDIDLATTWKQYTLKFRVNPDASGAMRSPLFQLGDTAGTVWLRNVTLTEAK